jgi:hypothetical protein
MVIIRVLPPTPFSVIEWLEFFSKKLAKFIELTLENKKIPEFLG